MKVSRFFTLAEFEHSETAKENNIDNSITSDRKIDYVRTLSKYILDPIRLHVGKAVLISSGFRCYALNSLLGGANNSGHMYGLAADIVSDVDLFELFEWIVNESNLVFDQCIYEKKGDRIWIHISISESHKESRSEVLMFNGVNYSRYEK